jgi:hypothetical protein
MDESSRRLVFDLMKNQTGDISGSYVEPKKSELLKFTAFQLSTEKADIIRPRER